MNENGPAGIEVERIVGPIAACSCFVPLVFHM